MRHYWRTVYHIGGNGGLQQTAESNGNACAGMYVCKKTGAGQSSNRHPYCIAIGVYLLRRVEKDNKVRTLTPSNNQSLMLLLSSGQSLRMGRHPAKVSQP